MSVLPEGRFGARVTRRLEQEQLIWFTTIATDGTPQPNPVWFLWEPESDSLLIYNATRAKRIDHVAARPQVALNFDSDTEGGDVVVLTGLAELAPDAPANSKHPAYQEKYRDRIARIGSDVEKFARDYSVPLRVRITKIRGH